jgi:hypothetical protein
MGDGSLLTITGITVDLVKSPYLTTPSSELRSPEIKSLLDFIFELDFVKTIT